MAFIIPGLRRGILFSTPLILASPMLLTRQFRHPVLCDAPDPLAKITSDLGNGQTRTARSSTLTASGGLNPRAVRQISLGSVLGVLGGLGVSVFSKPLALLIGLGIAALQILEHRGIHLIPYSYLQRRFQRTNVHSLIFNNVAFKLSFGLTFALASFAEF